MQPGTVSFCQRLSAWKVNPCRTANPRGNRRLFFKMVQILGKYQYVSNENFEEYVKSLGQYEAAGPLLNSQPVVEIQKDGDQWVITITSDGKTSTSTFKFNELYDEQLPSFGRTFKSVTTMDGEKIRTETQLTDDLKIIRVYEFTDSGMTVHLSSDKLDVTASRTYKRL